jgi:hypothetical protein
VERGACYLRFGTLRRKAGVSALLAAGCKLSDAPDSSRMKLREGKYCEKL